MAITSQQLRRLSPTEFENLTFDILIYSGLQNVVWRTPASDGGKDITGTFVSHEFNGTSKIQKWNIECKHFKASVSWKNIVEKIYFGKNENIDFILIATSSTISNQCKDEIFKWNKNNSIPQIRYWQGCDILNRINSDSYISHKYFGTRRDYISFFPNSTLLSLKKIILASHSEVICGQTPRALDAAKSIFELIDDVSCDIDSRGDTAPKTNYDESDEFDFVRISGVEPGIIDKYVLKAVASLFFTYTGCEKIECTTISHCAMKFTAINKMYNMTDDMVRFITQLVALKAYCLEYDSDSITLAER